MIKRISSSHLIILRQWFRIHLELASTVGLTLLIAYRGSQEQQSQPRPQDGSSQSWYPPSVVSSPTSGPATPSGTSSSSYSSQRPTERMRYPSHVSPAEAA